MRWDVNFLRRLLRRLDRWVVGMPAEERWDLAKRDAVFFPTDPIEAEVSYFVQVLRTTQLETTVIIWRAECGLPPLEESA